MTAYLTQPLSKETIREKIISGESIEEVVRVGLVDLIDKDIDSLNELVEGIILGLEGDSIEISEGDNPIVTLSDISYNIIGHERNENGGYVLLLVSAELNAY